MLNLIGWVCFVNYLEMTQALDKLNWNELKWTLHTHLVRSKISLLLYWGRHQLSHLDNISVIIVDRLLVISESIDASLSLFLFEYLSARTGSTISSMLSLKEANGHTIASLFISISPYPNTCVSLTNEGESCQEVMITGYDHCILGYWYCKDIGAIFADMDLNMTSG